MDRAGIVSALAAMTDDELSEAIAESRGEPVGEMSPMERAAAALRRSRGLDRKSRASKEDAATALRRYAKDNGGGAR